MQLWKHSVLFKLPALLVLLCLADFVYFVLSCYYLVAQNQQARKKIHLNQNDFCDIIDKFPYLPIAYDIYITETLVLYCTCIILFNPQNNSMK